MGWEAGVTTTAPVEIGKPEWATLVPAPVNGSILGSEQDPTRGFMLAKEIVALQVCEPRSTGVA